MRIAVLALCFQGARLGKAICAALPQAELHLHEAVEPVAGSLRFSRVLAATAGLVGKVEAFVFVMPTGVAVRAMAPQVKDKHTDPAVVALDVGGRWAVSLLSGHEGGANDLAMRVANAVGAEPVVSTTTEAAKTLIAGIGSRRGVPASGILEALDVALAAAGCGHGALRLIATAGVKATETGLLQAAADLAVPLRIIPDEEIRTWGRAFPVSELARERVGVPAVAEPCAMLAGRRTRLVLPKNAHNGVTVALAREVCPWLDSAPEA